MAAGLAVALCSGATGAAAQAKGAPDEATRNAARALAAEGDALYAQGDYAGAADRFARGYALLPAPTLGVRWARALAHQGKLIEAEERYVATVRTELEPAASGPFRAAVEEATAELAQLRPRIPKLIVVRRAGVGSVRLDGKEVPEALLGVARPVDPGEHVVEADNATSAQVTLAESETKRVELLPLRAGESPSAGDGRRTAGWIAIGFGGVAMSVGLLGGALALGKKGSLDDGCNASGACPPEREGDLDAYRAAGTVATIGFIAGAVGIGAGAVLLLTAPEPAAAQSAPSSRRSGARVGAWIGFGRLGIAGTL
jgi:hypothetical protein